MLQLLGLCTNINLLVISPLPTTRWEAPICTAVSVDVRTSSDGKTQLGERDPGGLEDDLWIASGEHVHNINICDL